MTRLSAQFWAGRFATKDQFWAFVGEDPRYFDEDNDRGEGGLPLSAFIGSQGQVWYDHDFMEVAFSDASGGSAAFAASYSDGWGREFDRRLAQAGPQGANAMIMVMLEYREGEAPYKLVRAPVSVTGDGFSLSYLGEIDFDG